MRKIERSRPIGQMTQAWKDGSETPRKTLEGFLKVIDEREHEVRAFTTLDIEGARRSADAATERYKQGRPLSAIDGLATGIKDNLETFDLPTTFGSPIFKGWNGGRDSAVAYGLRQSGAVIVGKTVTTEFASAHTFGETRNPHDLTRTPGGSSSGSAAAVGAGMLPIAIGTQVMGSVLRPAGFNGVIGFKPTYGALNKGGSSDSYSQNTVGMLAVNLEDIWAVCHAIATKVGGDPGFPPFNGGPVPGAPRKPLRLAAIETAAWPVAEGESKAAFAAACDALRADGVSFIDRTSSKRVERLEQTIANARDVALRLCCYEGLWPFADMDVRHGDLFSANMKTRNGQAQRMSPDDYVTALNEREAMRDALLTLKGEVDGFVTLSNVGPAPVGFATTGNSNFNVAISALRVPAFSLPLLMSADLPVGFQVFGFPHQDRALSEVAGFMLAKFGAGAAAWK